MRGSCEVDARFMRGGCEVILGRWGMPPILSVCRSKKGISLKEKKSGNAFFALSYGGNEKKLYLCRLKVHIVYLSLDYE